MDIDRGALLQVFLTDSEEDLARLEVEVLALESRPNEANVDGIFRIAHTLKGNAAILSLDGFARMAHAIEDVLHAVRSRQLALSGDLASSLLAGVDALRAMLGAVRAGAPDDPTPHAALEAELAAWVAAADGKQPGDLPGPTDTTPPVRPPSAPEPRVEAAAETTFVGNGEGNLEVKFDGTFGQALRIEMAKIDQLLSLASRALVLQGQMGAALIESGAANGDLLELHQRNERLLMELQDWVIDARMIPVSTLFRQHTRTVRDAARSQSKQARLEVEGERVRVDTGIGESARDVLTHLVRNAIDHGIEAPSVRVAQGKSPEGTITLRAAQKGNQVVIQVADDGAGFNLGKIRQRARMLGRPNADAMTVQELHRLVFEPGFSTAERVTELSGRGVGMDVVRRNVEDLHGTVDIDSVEGEGTTVELRLPLNLSVIDGFWVDVSGTDYVLPLDEVIECLELPAERRRGRDGDGIIDLRGEPLVCLNLREILDPKGATRPLEQVVVVRHRSNRVGLGVDAIRGERQTVIKPLGRLFRAVAGISGSTMRPDGSVAFVIDIARLLRSAGRQATAVAATV
ncbi:MAG TPA: chemotaxis protein CheA [Polyangia bacterium]|nr:chemotaxis protein CheA [Polyangia bacterium]